MLNAQSVKVRIIVSSILSAVRSVIGFSVGLIVARGLSPSGYGDLMFLLGSFVAIRSLLDLGSSNAFFTFLSQRSRGRRFYVAYFSWLTFQFVITLALLGLIIPSGLFEKIWLGHDRGIVVLAFVAAFMQQQIWQAVSQIGEAKRKTVKVQLMNLGIALIYLLAMVVFSALNQLTVEGVLIVLAAQYAFATVFAYRLFNEETVALIDEKSLREIFQEYWKYCRPLAVLAVISFAYDFADKWMLQRYGGAVQQGYFQIASQFAAVSLLATTSILSVFWKEIADAWGRQDKARVEMLYRKVNRGLVMLGAIISGLLLPWSEQIVKILLGESYSHGWPVLAIMLLYPIHQSMGQIGGTMFLASGQTRRYTKISIVMMLLSIPVSYFVVAPASDAWLGGLELGALGMACKMVLLGVISVNIQAWVIAKYGGWKFDWAFQVIGVPLMIGLGFVSKLLAGLFWSADSINVTQLIPVVMIGTLFYVLLLMASLWWMPWLIGADREGILRIISKSTARES